MDIPNIRSPQWACPYNGAFDGHTQILLPAFTEDYEENGNKLSPVCEKESRMKQRAEGSARPAAAELISTEVCTRSGRTAPMTIMARHLWWRILPLAQSPQVAARPRRAG